MGVPTSEVGYISATTGRGDHEVHKGHVVALGGGTNIGIDVQFPYCCQILMKLEFLNGFSKNNEM
jgi:hypothetical protein